MLKTYLNYITPVKIKFIISFYLDWYILNDNKYFMSTYLVVRVKIPFHIYNHFMSIYLDWYTCISIYIYNMYIYIIYPYFMYPYWSPNCRLMWFYYIANMAHGIRKWFSFNYIYAHLLSYMSCGILLRAVPFKVSI